MPSRRMIIGIVLALAVVLGGGWWLSQSDDSPPADRIPIGAGVIASGSQARELHAKPVAAPKTEPFVKALTEPFEVQVKGQKGGKLKQPVTLYLPTTAKPGDPVMLASKDPGKPWEYLGGQDGVKVVAIDGKHYIQATVPHLSIKLGFSPRDWIKSQWNQAVTKATAGLVIDKSEPKCTNQAEAKKQRYGVQVAQKGTLVGCVGYKNGGAQLLLKNIRRYAVVVHHKGMTRTATPQALLSLASQGKFNTANSTTLLPDEVVELKKTLQPGESVSISAEHDGRTQSLTRLDAAMRSIAKMYELLGVGNASVVELANLVLQSTDCTNGLATFSVPEMMSSCFPPELMDKYTEKQGKGIGLLPLIGEFVGGLSTWVVSEISIVVDEWKGDDRAFIKLLREKAPRYKLPHQCADYGNGDTVTIMKGTVSCDEAIEVALSYNRDSKNPRDITAKDCAGANGKPCTHFTGTWHCYGGEGLTGCKKGGSTVYRGSSEETEDYLVNNTPLAGNYYGQGIEVIIDSHGNGVVHWGCPTKSSGTCNATFAPMTSYADPLWVSVKSSDYSGPADMDNLYSFSTSYQFGVRKGSVTGTIEFYGASADDIGYKQPLCNDNAPAYTCGGGA